MGSKTIKSSMGSSSISVAVVAALFFSFIMLISIMVWGYFQFIDGEFVQRPLVFESTVLHVTKDFYVPGEIVQAQMRYIKNRPIIERVNWTLVSDRLIEYTPREMFLPPGHHDMLIDIARIPENVAIIPNARWKFSGLVRVPVNWIKDVQYHVETTQFAIGLPLEGEQK